MRIHANASTAEAHATSRAPDDNDRESISSRMRSRFNKSIKANTVAVCFGEVSTRPAPGRSRPVRLGRGGTGRPAGRSRRDSGDRSVAAAAGCTRRGRRDLRSILSNSRCALAVNQGLIYGVTGESYWTAHQHSIHQIRHISSFSPLLLHHRRVV
jgi:hypothetical protein